MLQVDPLITHNFDEGTLGHRLIRLISLMLDEVDNCKPDMLNDHEPRPEAVAGLLLSLAINAATHDEGLGLSAEAVYGTIDRMKVNHLRGPAT